MIFDLVRIVIDIVVLTTPGMCTQEVLDNLPWTVASIVFEYEQDGLCHIRYIAEDIPEWAIEWRPTLQQYSEEASVILRVGQ